MVRVISSALATRNAALFYATLFTLTVLACFYPFLALSVMMVLAFCIQSRWSLSLWIYSSSLFLGLLASVLDLNYTYYADLSRYYASYDSYTILQSIIDFKIFRGIVFEILKSLGLKVEYYSLISVFIICFLLQKTSIEVLNDLGYKVRSNKSKSLYIILLMSTVPVTTFLGYETILSISFFFFGSYKLSRKKILIGTVFLFLSCITHILAVYFVSIYVMVLFFKGYGFRYQVASLSALTFLLVAVNYRLSVGIKFIDKPLSKLFSYFNGSWSEYATIHDKALFFYVFLKVVFAIFILVNVGNNWKLKNHYLIKIMMISLPFMVVFCFSRTLSLRFIEFGYVMYMPIIYILSLELRRKKKRLFIIVYVFINVFSYHNLLYARFISKNMKFGDGYFLLMNPIDINNATSNMASDKLIFDIKDN